MGLNFYKIPHILIFRLRQAERIARYVQLEFLYQFSEYSTDALKSSARLRLCNLNVCPYSKSIIFCFSNATYFCTGVNMAGDKVGGANKTKKKARTMNAASVVL